MGRLCLEISAPSRKIPTGIAPTRQGWRGFAAANSGLARHVPLGNVAQITRSENWVSKGAQPLLVLRRAWRG